MIVLAILAPLVLGTSLVVAAPRVPARSDVMELGGGVLLVLALGLIGASLTWASH